MTNYWINWRFGVRHLEVGPWYVSISVNPYNIDNPPATFFERF